ncbi:unnamed protein product [Sphenostylis stenocarpa]|uniref:Uncharacterized protein n=1 Tax=Sphenostylis stenocarpa TaxID=92480 RepID=A0AA86VME1_9FABA|nr:unnamed protein product [Sphenostylis stenocarpa]
MKHNRNNNQRVKAGVHRERNLQYRSHELQKRSRAIQGLRKQPQKNDIEPPFIKYIENTDLDERANGVHFLSLNRIPRIAVEPKGSEMHHKSFRVVLFGGEIQWEKER